MDQVVSSPPQHSNDHPSLLLVYLRRFVCVSLSLAGVAVILHLGILLFGEVAGLTRDLASARDREPMGYIGISAENPEFKPPACVREENGCVLLWAGSGRPGQAGWFDVSATNLPLRQFEYAFGRDKVRAIDYPILQDGNGEIVRRIYIERPVLGIVVGGEPRAYPLTVLEKVEVVNDEIAGRPLAVTYCPLLEKVAVYERTLNGELVGLGTSGYLYEDAFVLYDRGTDSLWYPQDDGLKAITGPLCGRVLAIAPEKAERVSWGEWLRRYPNTQVVVGADRSRGIPMIPGQGEATRSM